MAKSNTALQQIFRHHPELTELYIDARGKVWTELATAEQQSQVTIVTRAEIMKGVKESWEMDPGSEKPYVERVKDGKK
jgi:hypothetical protein